MLTLSIDTATDRCAVALWEGSAGEGRLRASADRALARGHGEALFGMIGAMLDEAGVCPRDLTRIVAVRGPGTFTGLRIGLAAARGLALALGVPSCGVTSFALIAATDREEHGEEDDPRLVAIDARRGELYVQTLEADLRPLGGAAVLSPEAAASALLAGPLVAVGTGAPALVIAARRVGRELAGRVPGPPPAALLARLGAAADPEVNPALPLYVRAPDAKLPEAVPLRAAAIP